MNYLMIIKKTYLIFLLIISIIFFFHGNLLSSENKILFKINNKSFTSFDLEKRKNYLEFIGDNNLLEYEIVFNDFFSSHIFYEFYLKNNINDNFVEKAKEVFENINNENKKINKVVKIELENILFNIELDLIRKAILEEMLNNKKNEIISNNNAFIYNYKIEYINIDVNELNNKNLIINEETFNNISIARKQLDQKNINYFIKKKEVDNINLINEEIKKNINLNNYFFIIEKNNLISLINIEKNFKTYDGLVANLFSVKSNNILNKSDINCANINNNKDKYDITIREYEYVKLNEDVRENLISINDFITFKNENIYNYIILCGIKYNKDVLLDIDLNKKINLAVDEIETNFINKYSKEFDIVLFNE